jgi:hypothetical protein
VSCSSRLRDRKHLEDRVERGEYQDLLNQLQVTEPFHRQFANWAEAIAFMRAGTSDDPRKNELLLPMLRAHTVDQDTRWRELLMLVMWPGLESIYVRKRHWDEDDEERWAKVSWAFNWTVCTLNVERRPERIVQRLYNGTVHRLGDQCRRDWGWKNRREGYERRRTDQPKKPTSLAYQDERFGQVEARVDTEAKLQSLREHRDAGRLSDADYLLLAGTLIHRRSLASCAEELGISREAAKKRKLRAEAKIREFEQKSSESLSPPAGSDGLFLIEAPQDRAGSGRRKA